ncbi:gas vesicle protein GvpG [Anabaena sp. FACHB-709]|uniref:Gas vesicle protein GvpG n=2 Tax=Nostocaceae TaxID=1162 RepID=A0A1Z4KFX7_ANAVA|nr:MULTISPECIES: gas vesicle protein GvpG [Nostocaceae]BAY67872.1 gas vesicle protein GvpG [Trichormus variabilis NIES-23]HBW29621.1 gas vesicle protein [Nostoc sp. UBA8866]MBD2170037.1 gas vesicle protein GvpG [Anabaena cylindrica FACHB-318]MBD2261542.1 gas vesicle protein GvpG [Anabaena sp. FACHB-709]MBD2271126.1 gas vesicle protein GvpG [Nostoc sp. PCC 7120 = FACHB-418]
MLGKILLLPVMGPINGLMWIGEQIQERTNTEFDAQENLHKQLLSLQLKFDMGEISEEEFDIQEEEILLKIQALEAEERLNAESEEDDDLDVQPIFILASEENPVYQDQSRFSEEYEDKEDLVLSP